MRIEGDGAYQGRRRMDFPTNTDNNRDNTWQDTLTQYSHKITDKLGGIIN
jgi:hypothetical protein